MPPRTLERRKGLRLSENLPAAWAVRSAVSLFAHALARGSGTGRFRGAGPQGLSMIRARVYLTPSCQAFTFTAEDAVPLACKERHLAVVTKELTSTRTAPDLRRIWRTLDPTSLCGGPRHVLPTRTQVRVERRMREKGRFRLSVTLPTSAWIVGSISGDVRRQASYYSSSVFAFCGSLAPATSFSEIR